MNDIDALYAAIVAQPCEDTPRLAFADALDERNGPGDAEQAAFIRRSIELSLLGSPRRTIDNTILQERGENYFELFVNEQDGDFEVGQRIDVNGEEISHIHHKSKNKLYRGLLVTKIIPDDDFDETGSLTLALKRDEYSVPFPKRKHAELQKFVLETAKKNWKQWVKDWGSGKPGRGKIIPRVHNGRFALLNSGAQDIRGAYFPSWQFDRGFTSWVALPWFHWAQHADEIVRLLPLTHVEFMDTPEWEYDKNGVTIAGQLLPWSHAVSPGFGDSYDEWVEEKLPTFLSLRWPTIPPDNWTLPD